MGTEPYGGYDIDLADFLLKVAAGIVILSVVAMFVAVAALICGFVGEELGWWELPHGSY